MFDVYIQIINIITNEDFEIIFTILFKIIFIQWLILLTPNFGSSNVTVIHYLKRRETTNVSVPNIHISIYLSER